MIHLFIELNIIKPRDYRENKYREPKSDLDVPYKQFTLILLELTSLGYVSKSIKEMKTLEQKLNINEFTFVIIESKHMSVLLRKICLKTLIPDLVNWLYYPQYRVEKT